MRSTALALRDCYHFWKARNEFPRAGKLLLDDPADSTTIQMFFDDNIGHTSAHIADARDARTGESLPFSGVRAAQLNRAEPVNAILDPKYFIRCACCQLVVAFALVKLLWPSRMTAWPRLAPALARQLVHSLAHSSYAKVCTRAQRVGARLQCGESGGAPDPAQP